MNEQWAHCSFYNWEMWKRYGKLTSTRTSWDVGWLCHFIIVALCFCICCIFCFGSIATFIVNSRIIRVFIYLWRALCLYRSFGDPLCHNFCCGLLGLLDFGLHAFGAQPVWPFSSMMSVSVMHVSMTPWCMYLWCMHLWYMYLLCDILDLGPRIWSLTLVPNHGPLSRSLTLVLFTGPWPMSLTLVLELHAPMIQWTKKYFF